MKNLKNFSREDLAMIWGFGLFCGGTNAVRDGVTLQSVVSFVYAMLTGAFVWVIFRAAGIAFEEDPPKKQWIYEVIFLLFITYISTGALWS